MTAKLVERRLKNCRDPEKAAFFPRFFKSAKGDYGEGDVFLGVVVPQQRLIAREFQDLTLEEITRLLASKYHESRLTALFILVRQFEKAGNDKTRRNIYNFYLKNTDRINNWDLVDSSAHKIVGPWLLTRNHKPLFKLAKANNLWENRIAIISTLHFIKQGQLDTTIEIAEILLTHEHDLIHKAVGWMLRELGKQDEKRLIQFLKNYSDSMPRTMLRYAIEKFPKPTRKQILSGDYF